jgi:FAD/FMN-containing dehydrogenase/Fe-S oxidoreductase
MAIRALGPAFWQRLANEIEGDVVSDLFSRGRYATDASIYQCFPAGAACPKTEADVAVIVEMAREAGLSLVPRGGGTSTAGQALGEGLVVDFSKYMNRVVEIDAAGMTCLAEPGCAPAMLNSAVRAHGLVFPVDIALSRQATLGGMLGNNASGIRSLRYGRMGDNTKSAHALLADGQRVHFGEVSEPDGISRAAGHDRLLDLLQFGEIHEKAIKELLPALGPGIPAPEGYNLRSLLPSDEHQNLARLLAGSEGTLALVTKLELKLVRRRENRAIGVCRFADLTSALGAVPKIAALNPVAIELLDRSLLDFLAPQPSFDSQLARLLQGDPGALLLVEFDEENPVENTRLLKALDESLAVSGGRNAAARKLALIEVMGRKAQNALWRLRRDTITRALTLKSAAQPISFLEDGAVPLDRLADYGASLEALFEKYNVRTAIYGHVGGGILNVRPILNLQHEQDRKRMRALQEEMVQLLHTYGGALSSGHATGLVRGEAIERLRGAASGDLFTQLKALLDPGSLLNPGKLVRPPRFDDEALLRAPAGSRMIDAPVSLTWGAAASAERAHDHAKRCSGLSLCRSSEFRFACPSYGVTGDERDSPRGRANTVRLALSGQLGDGAMGSGAMMDTMRSCVSCKACKTACPFGIDIPKMKVEALSAARAGGRRARGEEMFARLPEYAARARRWRGFLNLRDVIPGLPRLSERHLGLAADRPWPRFMGRPFEAAANAEAGPSGLVAIFADTFNQAFEPANLRAAASVLTAAGYGVTAFRDEEPGQPLCCGRTYYDAGFIEEARQQADRFSRALSAFEEKGIQVIGLEPACTLMVRDEYSALGLPTKDKTSIMLFEEFVAKQSDAGLFSLPLKAIEAELVLHAHCHERALGIESAARTALDLVPQLSITAAPSTCCGLNGPMGMTPDTLEASLAMAELALFPAIRKAGRDAFVAATGFSCRKQILDGLGRPARHPAMILELALKGDAEIVT